MIANSKNAGLNAAPEPQAFVNVPTWPDTPEIILIARTLADPQTFDAAVIRKLRQLDPGLIAKFETLDEQISSATAGPRFNSILLGIFAILAFLMTAVGIYGVLAFAVAQRTQEIGIRFALGARPGQVLAMILREGAALVVAGVLLGSAAFCSLSRYLESFLYGVRLSDPRTYAAVLIPIAVVALCATLIPARRAASVDAAIALRQY